MSEPPKPRRPEEGGGDSDPTHVPTEDEYFAEGDVGPDEFFDTDWGQIDRDDQVTDHIGQSGDVTISEESTPKEREAADVLGEWNTDVGSIPLPPKLDIDAILAEHQRRQREEDAAPPGPRTPEIGGSTRMPLNEDAQIIRQVANSQGADGAVMLANTNLSEVQINTDRIGDAVAALQEAIGGVERDSAAAGSAAGGEEGDAIQGAGQQAMQALSEVAAMAEQARLKCEEAVATLQAATLGLDTARTALQEFRGVCGNIATRHGA